MSQSNPHPPHVLVVEDETDLWMLVEDTLSSLCRVSTARTAPEALHMAQEHDIDLFLIDLHLGHGDTGLDLARQLRAQDRYQDTPMIAVTAYRDVVGSRNLTEAGFTTSLAKPYSTDALMKLVREFLR